jgi:hypothetical protein
MKSSLVLLRKSSPEGLGWVLLWLFGVPVPILAVLMVLRDFVTRAR